MIRATFGCLRVRMSRNITWNLSKVICAWGKFSVMPPMKAGHMIDADRLALGGPAMMGPEILGKDLDSGRVVPLGEVDHLALLLGAEDRRGKIKTYATHSDFDRGLFYCLSIH
jgi:hypothetical protein